jgi:hypothetical protein
MAEARDIAEWQHTFAIVAQIHNYHRDPKRSEAIDWRKFCPHLNRGQTAKAQPPTPEQREMLRAMFPGKKRKEA